MKRNWAEEKLIERWTLFPDELALVGAKAGHTRPAFAVMTRFFAEEGRFPRDKREVPAEVLRFVAEQVGPGPEAGLEGWLRYDWSGRSVKYHRAQIRRFFGFREATAEDGERVAGWLLEEVLPREQDAGRLREAFRARCRALKIEPPTPGRVERLTASASRRFEERFCASVLGRLPEDAPTKTRRARRGGRPSRPWHPPSGGRASSRRSGRRSASGPSGQPAEPFPVWAAPP
ncbi:MAG: hypothetical protein AVDCRST_MAG02-1686 [uncultured Rubrobacteraceae bacterium]|uniref:DUF4158 domain-containing protein n=1 Tax=uncultured Rubrobacteraceae bacterium TaxID=349277 RepID=A0A6J4R5V6_9ACTN|nr:MAG: hypothetical protein AVDCRST_MAG02-1686 [uncultured Rubrobacteraceae bacterium]